MDCKFCNFIAGKENAHENGYPFVTISEKKHTLAFVSQDSPINEDAHMLVIPKKHFQNIHDVPATILAELIAHAASLGLKFHESHDGYNLLLNNDRAAGQYVMHVHMHVIPRDNNDGITIENWKRQKITEREFLKLCEKAKRKGHKTLRVLQKPSGF